MREGPQVTVEFSGMHTMGAQEGPLYKWGKLEVLRGQTKDILSLTQLERVGNILNILGCNRFKSTCLLLSYQLNQQSIKFHLLLIGRVKIGIIGWGCQPLKVFRESIRSIIYCRTSFPIKIQDLVAVFLTVLCLLTSL